MSKTWDQIYAEKFGRDWREDVKNAEIGQKMAPEAGLQLEDTDPNPPPEQPSNPPKGPKTAENGLKTAENGQKHPFLGPICTKLDPGELISGIFNAETGQPFTKQLKGDGSLMITHDSGWILHLIRTVIGLRARVYRPEEGWAKKSAKIEFKEFPAEAHWLEFCDVAMLCLLSGDGAHINHMLSVGKLYKGSDDVIMMTESDMTKIAPTVWQLPVREKDIKFTHTLIPWDNNVTPTF